jgi:hypothetical protein
MHARCKVDAARAESSGAPAGAHPKSSACCIAALQAGDLKSEQNACSRSLRFVEIRNFWEIMQ